MEFVHINIKSIKDNYYTLSQPVSYIFHSHNMTVILALCRPVFTMSFLKSIWGTLFSESTPSLSDCEQSPLSAASVSGPSTPDTGNRKKIVAIIIMTIQVLSTYVTSTFCALTAHCYHHLACIYCNSAQLLGHLVVHIYSFY